MAVAPIFSFLTIEEVSEAIYKEKGSKFLAFAIPVQNETEIKTKLAELKKKYFDASHHCYAWVLGADKKYFRAFDDGEPNHSAGTPILGQIKSKNLTDVLVLVVRYFGGTKLGVGSLIQAYKSAAEMALNNAKIIEIKITVPYTLNYAYDVFADVMKLVKEFELKIVKQSFENETELKMTVKLILEEKFLAKLKLMNSTGTKIEFDKK